MPQDTLRPCPRTFRGKDGRLIAWHEYGQTDAPRATLIYCHGTPGSGYEALFLDRTARQLGLRVIAPDRPGMGKTSALPGRTVAAWAQRDVVELLDHLAIERFSVVGFSAGGPHAMALAALLPERVDRLLLLAPFTHHGLWSTRIGLALTPLRIHASWLLFSFFPKTLIEAAALALPRHLSSSRLVTALSKPVAGRTAAYRMATCQHYALHFSLEGAVHDEQAIQGDWGFAESAVRVPVHLWVAGSDLAIRAGRARNLGLRLGAQIHELPEDGHFSLLTDRASTVLALFEPATVD